MAISDSEAFPLNVGGSPILSSLNKEVSSGGSGSSKMNSKSRDSSVGTGRGGVSFLVHESNSLRVLRCS